jgi:hypothetical protein
MSDEANQELIPPARSFADLLRHIEGGRFLNEISDAMRDLIAEMEDRHADGANKVKAKVKLEFSLTFDRGAYDLVPKFEVKLPEVPRARSIFYATPDNNLTPQNPKQMNLDLRRVDDKRDVRTVS